MQPATRCMEGSMEVPAIPGYPSEFTLMNLLELKCGALDLLSMIKDMGKKIVVITEGPQDAQERTVQGLGIEG